MERYEKKQKTKIKFKPLSSSTLSASTMRNRQSAERVFFSRLPKDEFVPPIETFYMKDKCIIRGKKSKAILDR